jgi:hypothetical protein
MGMARIRKVGMVIHKPLLMSIIEVINSFSELIAVPGNNHGRVIPLKKNAPTSIMKAKSMETISTMPMAIATTLREP